MPCLQLKNAEIGFVRRNRQSPAFSEQPSELGSFGTGTLVFSADKAEIGFVRHLHLRFGC